MRQSDCDYVCIVDRLVMSPWWTNNLALMIYLAISCCCCYIRMCVSREQENKIARNCVTELENLIIPKHNSYHIVWLPKSWKSCNSLKKPTCIGQYIDIIWYKILNPTYQYRYQLCPQLDEKVLKLSCNSALTLWHFGNQLISERCSF